MNFNLDGKNYEIIDIFNDNNTNYMIYSDSNENKKEKNIYGAKIIINNKEIKLNEIETEEEWEIINKKVEEIRSNL